MSLKVETVQQSLIPQFILNLFDALNHSTKAVSRVAQSTDRFVEGADEIATLMLRQQRKRLLAELGED